MRDTGLILERISEQLTYITKLLTRIVNAAETSAVAASIQELHQYAPEEQEKQQLRGDGGT